MVHMHASKLATTSCKAKGVATEGRTGPHCRAACSFLETNRRPATRTGVDEVENVHLQHALQRVVHLIVRSTGIPA